MNRDQDHCDIRNLDKQRLMQPVFKTQELFFEAVNLIDK